MRKHSKMQMVTTKLLWEGIFTNLLINFTLLSFNRILLTGKKNLRCSIRFLDELKRRER